MTDPEFTRPEQLSTIGSAARSVAVEADAGERTALARRFGLVAIDALAGDFTLRREANGFAVRGRVRAVVAQACSVTGDPVRTRVDEAVELRFVADDAAGEGDEVELSDDSIDVLTHDGQAIDVGEVAAETMMLALDPFPRSPGADAALQAAGVLGEGETGPFAALAGLLKR